MKHGFHGPRTAPRGVSLKATPSVEFLLVLLLVFMATARLQEKPIDVSGARASPSQPATRVSDALGTEPIVLEYTADRRVLLNHQRVALVDLDHHLREIYARRRDKTMLIEGAATLPYRAIVEVMDLARGAGVQRVGIITEAMRRQSPNAGSVRGKDGL